MRLAAKPGLHFWSTGYAWGTCRIKPAASGYRVELRVLAGSITLQVFAVGDNAHRRFIRPLELHKGRAKAFCCEAKE